jgi:RNA polymerase sigma factor (sigma-70 family)
MAAARLRSRLHHDAGRHHAASASGVTLVHAGCLIAIDQMRFASVDHLRWDRALWPVARDADEEAMAGDRLGESFDSVLAAAQADAGWAFERLWHAYAGPVTGYLRLHGARDADDVASEVFLSAFRALDRFVGDESAFRSWLFTIAHRRLLDARRAAGRRPVERPLEEVGADRVEAGAGPEVLRRLAEERVRAMCGRLVEDQRDVLLLRMVAGMTVEEVAHAVGKSPGAVKALQRRGLAALRKILEREGVPL